MSRSRRAISRASVGNGHAREAQFKAVMADCGVALSHPRRFRFKRTSYTPDFYSPSQGIFYEVIGSRQRAAGIRALLDLMDVYHPGITVRCVHPDGQLFRTEHCQRLLPRWRVPYATELADALDARGMILADLARVPRTQVPPAIERHALWAHGLKAAVSGHQRLAGLDSGGRCMTPTAPPTDTRHWRPLSGSRPCCAKAERLQPGDPRDVYCVCAWREWCPEHGRTCVGSHD